MIEHGRNYLRVRGEYDAGCGFGLKPLELPPRARRIHCSRVESSSGIGTTSACAENTPPNLVFYAHLRNYLRVRGEYLPGGREWLEEEELPPRARRIPLKISRSPSENVNYLRVRGEYRFLAVVKFV